MMSKTMQMHLAAFGQRADAGAADARRNSQAAAGGNDRELDAVVLGVRPARRACRSPLPFLADLSASKDRELSYTAGANLPPDSCSLRRGRSVSRFLSAGRSSSRFCSASRGFLSVLSPARHWVGLDNFRQLFHRPALLQVAGQHGVHNDRFAIPLTMAASLAIAMLLNIAIGGRSFFRAACYLPAVTPVVASSLLWVWGFSIQARGFSINRFNWLYATRALMEWFQSLIRTPFHGSSAVAAG